MWQNEAPCLEFNGNSTETKTTWSEFLNGGKAIAEQILPSEEINPKEPHYENHSMQQHDGYRKPLGNDKFV